MKAILTIYRFAHPKHFDYLMSAGMGARWLPTWFLFRGMRPTHTLDRRQTKAEDNKGS